MHKTILALALAWAASGALRAGLLELDPHAGYTTVSMGDLNHANAAIYGWYPSDHAESLSSGYVAGLDLTTSHLTRVEALKLGIRAEYLRTNPAEMKDVTLIAHQSDALDYVDQGNLASVLLGGKLSAPYLSDRLLIGLGAWAGCGYGTLDQSVTFDGNQGTNLLPSGVYTSLLLVGELEATLRWRLSQRLALDFSGGWRWADAGSMRDSKGAPLYNAEQYWELNKTAPVDVDFSGATAQGGLNIAF